MPRARADMNTLFHQQRSTTSRPVVSGPPLPRWTRLTPRTGSFELWRANRRVYGRRKLWKAAHRAAWNIGRDQVQRLMNILGITGVLRRKTTRTTVADPTAQRFPDRIQRAWSQAQRPDQWWVADFTYVHTSCGFS